MALAGDLIARREAGEAVVAARRAVALAPDEPDAHLALADALLAIWPRKIGNRAAAFAEIDHAELLGVDARELTERRGQPKGMGYTAAVWVATGLFLGFGIHGLGGRVGTAVAWPVMVVFLVGTAIVRVRPNGQSLRAVLETKRELSRRRLVTDEQLRQRAPVAAVFPTVLLMPGMYLAMVGAEDKTPPLFLAWPLLCGVPLVGAAVWIGVDRWLWPGTVIRALRQDAFAACSLLTTFTLPEVTAWLAVRGADTSGLWFTLFLGQTAWGFGSIIAAANLTSRRKKAAS